MYFGLEKDKVILAEVIKLMEVAHIQEIQFPTCLANIVLVPKVEGKWRVCVTFVTSTWHTLRIAIHSLRLISWWTLPLNTS